MPFAPFYQLAHFRLFHFQYVYPPRLGSDLDARDFLCRCQIYDVDGAGLGADPFDRDEGIPAVGRDDDAAGDFAGSGDTRQLLAWRDVDERDGLAALVRT